MVRDATLATGIVMSYAAQLSVPVLPVGYGELFLIIWITLSLGRILIGGRLEVTPALKYMGTFWIVLALTQSVGTIVGYFTTNMHLSMLLHDSMAYVLLATLTCLSAAEPDADVRLRSVGWWIVGIANAGLAFQVGLAWGWVHQSGVGPWYWDRFRGWSENPNQLALYCAVFGPLALHLATTTKSSSARVLGLCGIILPFFVGRLTKSDTFLYTSILTCLIFFGLRLRTWLTTANNKASLSRQIVVLSMVGFLPLAMSMTPYAVTEIDNVESFAKSLTKDKGGEATAETASLRLYLWEEAFKEGYESWSLGLGPGPHIERPPAANTQFLPRPFEAHSTILDLYTQGGLIAVLALLWIVGMAALSAWRAKLDALLALVTSIVIFGIPHLIIRHPIVWFALVLCLVAGTPRAIPQPARLRGY